MYQIPFTPEAVTVLAGMAMSLLFEFIPKLKAQLDELKPYQKMLAMAIASIAFSGIVFVMSCYVDLLVLVGLECNRIGFNILAGYAMTAFSANQFTYLARKLLSIMFAPDIK